MIDCSLSGHPVRLSGVAECASEASDCTARYVLNADSARLCTAMAYSTGARGFSTSDLIRIPDRSTWVEWPQTPWCEELRRYGITPSLPSQRSTERRGACVSVSPGGRRGRIRTFWCAGQSEIDLNASAMEAHFDLDGTAISGHSIMSTNRWVFRVVDNEMADVHALSRCFRFEFERSWAAYYANLPLSESARRKINRVALETIAPDIPLLLAFFLLIGAGRDSCRLTALPGQRLRGHLSRRREHVFWRMPAGLTASTLTLE